VRIRVLAFRHSPEIRETLRKDGWTLDEGPTPWFSAEHARARDGTAARRRLHRLGLLTSSDLRIEFCEEAPGRVGVELRRVGRAQDGVLDG
jgi:hypothetical protein